MRSDAWPQYCRAALVRSVGAAAAQFPGPGEEAPKRVHDVRKILKEARAIARLFLDCIGEPARVTITTLAATRRQIGRARDLDVMALGSASEPPPGISEPLIAAIAREREAAHRARRGLSASAPRPRLNAIVRRVEGWDLSAFGTEEIVARWRAPIARRGGAAYCIQKRGSRVRMHSRAASSICATNSRCSPARGRKRECAGRSPERPSRGARRFQRLHVLGIRGQARRVVAAGV